MIDYLSAPNLKRILFVNSIFELLGNPINMNTLRQVRSDGLFEIFNR